MPSPLTPERIVHRLVSAGDPAISPDGTSIVFVRSEADPNSNDSNSQLWLCGVNGSTPRRLTWSGSKNREGRWSPDGQQIAFVSDRAGGHAICLFSMEGGDAREVTRHYQPISDLAWSPDGSRLAYTVLIDPDDPDGDGPPAVVKVTRRRDYKHDDRGYLNDTRLQLFVVDLRSSERRMITTDAIDHYNPQWSPDGRLIAAQVRYRNGVNSRLALIDPANGATTWVGTEHGVVGLWAWSPSGDRILVAGDMDQSWQLDFFVYEVRAQATRRLTDDLQILPQAGFPTIWAPPAQPVWLNDRAALFHAYSHGASGLYEIDTDTGEIEQRRQWQALHQGLSVGDAHRFVVQSHSSLETTGELVVTDRQTGSFTTITHLNDAVLAESPMATWERFDIERDGLTIEAWLLFPPGFDPSKRYPLILDVHGGPQSFYGYGFGPVPELLATNGYLVAYANPRGSTSYGRAFAQGVVGDWGGGDFEDLMAVVDAVQTRPYVDPDRVGIFGYSYGGFMTSWTIGQTDRFKAAVIGAPVFDLESFYGTSDVGYVYGPMEWGGAPADHRDWCLAHSPSTFAHRATTPTLIIHGESDERCPIGQGEQLFVALNEAGCEVEFARYPGGVHAMLLTGTPALRVDALTRILAWFDAHLGDR